MTTEKFSKAEALGVGWNTMRDNLGFFIGLMLVAFVLTLIPSIIEALTKEDAPLISFVFGAVANVVQMIVSMGFIKIALKFADNMEAEFGDLFSCLHLFLKYLGGSILYLLIVLAGMILLIIPGIIWAIKFQFFSYFIIDEGLGPIEALTRSSEITTDAKWDLFLFDLLLVGINLLGLLAFLIGLFATLPMSMVASAVVYRKLLAQQEVAPAG